MNIHKLMSQNKKISLVSDRGCSLYGERYAELINGVLRWSSEGVGPPVRFEDYDKEWEVYPEVKEVRPENSGELWELRNMFYFTCYDGNGGLEFTDHMEAQWIFEGFGNYPIHNQAGWKRIHPPVEDESVERVVIEGIEWSEGMTVHPVGGDCRPILIQLIGKPPMKMILEIPKETE